MVKTDTYRDGGTVCIEDEDGTIFSIDNGIASSTKGFLYKGLPWADDSYIVISNEHISKFLDMVSRIDPEKLAENEYIAISTFILNNIKG